jgi:nucleoside-diphosphate-sugar epimerase
MRLFCFGLGYVALALARRLTAHGWTVAGTVRKEEKRAALAALGIEAIVFDGIRRMKDPRAALDGASHVLDSIPPDGRGDPALLFHAEDIARTAGLMWAGYLSSTVVYGDTGSAWADERRLPRPTAERGRRRADAEKAWLHLQRQRHVPAHVFRLAGLYGPGRSALDRVRDGTARKIVKPGHLFSRVHVDDVVATLLTSMAKPNPGAIYNVADDAPSPGHDVIDYACGLLGVAPPEPEPFEEAALSATAKSFYAEARRVSNARITQELGVRLAYPDYKKGLRAILAAEEDHHGDTETRSA